MSTMTVQRSFTVDEYYRMAEAGILSEDDRVELIEGRVLTMSPIGSRHAACVGRLDGILNRQGARRCLVWVQNPVRLDAYSEPQPDVALLRPRDDFCSEGHPGPSDVLLIVEVSESSEGYDRQVKVPLYARAGIPEVWVVSPAERVVWVHSGPAADGYTATRTARPGDVRALASIPELAVPVADVVG
ncbi:MAG: Uma2 family endonuclease [Candidatus Latescibacterota bacterium]